VVFSCFAIEVVTISEKEKREVRRWDWMEMIFSEGEVPSEAQGDSEGIT
jgi:hypothetical protein